MRLFFLILLLPLMGTAQVTPVDTTRLLQQINATGYEWKQGKFTGALYLPKDTQKLRSMDFGALAYKGDTVRLWSGQKWLPLVSGQTNAWTFTGNAGTNPSVNFLGTTDNQPLVFRVNNTKWGALYNTGGHLAFGELALSQPQTGVNCIALGLEALRYNTSGNGNIALGYEAFMFNTVRKGNVGIGWQAGQLNTVGEHHTYVGTHAGQFVNAGNENVAIGSYAMQYSDDTGFGQSTAVGTGASFQAASGITAVGYQSRSGLTPGNFKSLFSTSVGYKSLLNIENDTSVTVLGDFATSANSLKNATAIGSHAYVGASNSLVLGSINGTNGATSNTNVGIGISTPTAQLHTTGTVRLAGLTPSANAGDSMLVVNSANGDIGMRAIPNSIPSQWTSSSPGIYHTDPVSIGTSTVNSSQALLLVGTQVIKNASANNANAIEAQDNSGTVLAYIRRDGLIAGQYLGTADNVTAMLNQGYPSSGYGINIAGGKLLSWNSGAWYGTPLAAFYSNSSGLIEVNNGTSGQYRDLKFRTAFVTGDIINVATSKTPTSATDTGNAGDICWDSNYMYICTATNTWKRSALATW